MNISNGCFTKYNVNADIGYRSLLKEVANLIQNKETPEL